ncbi:MAG TPA: TonB family protein [Candidatus Bathyarchaeia archaeon]|nr:TonB family protein [Candidatus Bathyarchaeia archaeon]
MALTVDALAAPVAASLNDSKAKSVVVLDFVGPSTYVTPLGRKLADDFSAALAKSSSQFAVIDRARLFQVEKANRFAPDIVADPEMAVWIAKNVDAWAAVLGKLEVESGTFRLMIHCFRVKDAKELQQLRATHPANDDWKQLSVKNIDPDSEVITTEKSRTPSDPLMPTCVSCPRPQYPVDGLNKRMSEKVIMYVVVGVDGTARDFSIVKGPPNGFTVAAVQAVQTWRFIPGHDENGQPVAVRVPIEISYRIGP